MKKFLETITIPKWMEEPQRAIPDVQNKGMQNLLTWFKHDNNYKIPS